MKFRTTKIALLVAVFALATSLAGFAANEPCGVANQILCQGQDGTGIPVRLARMTPRADNGNFATVYDTFTLSQTWDVESFHFVGGYFNGGQAPITAWTLTFYNDAAGSPGNPIASGVFPGNGNETLIDANLGLYMYSLFFQSFDMGAGHLLGFGSAGHRFPATVGLGRGDRSRSGIPVLLRHLRADRR